MRRFFLTAMLGGLMAIFGGLCGAADHAVAYGGSEQIEGRMAAAESDFGLTYTVWYRYGGGRWTGISGLSYFDACTQRDSIIAQGGQAYVRFDGDDR